MKESKHYTYKNTVYKLLDHVENKTTREVEVLYTDGNLLYTRIVSDFYQKFSQVRFGSLEQATFDLINRLK